MGAFILNSWKSNLQSAVRFKYFSRVQSVVPQAGSCDLSARDHASVQVYSTHLFLGIFSTNRELLWRLLTCVSLAEEIPPNTVHPGQTKSVGI